APHRRRPAAAAAATAPEPARARQGRATPAAARRAAPATNRATRVFPPGSPDRGRPNGAPGLQVLAHARARGLLTRGQRPPSHLLELLLGHHLLRHHRGLDAMEEALEPAHEL